MKAYRGSTIVPVRVPTDQLDMMDAAILRVNLVREGEPFDRSSFIRAAITEKLQHYARSAKTRDRQNRRQTTKTQREDQ